MGDDKSEEAADRRRGLLKKVCSQERAVSWFPDDCPWSDSTSVRKPILLNWMPLSFLSSTSACYWDPQIAFRDNQDYYPLCNTLEEEYTIFSSSKQSHTDPCFDAEKSKGKSVHHVSKSTTTSFMISPKKNKMESY
jgi:hypothetical protein